MPNEHPLTLPRRDPEHIDLGRIKTDVEFLIDKVSRLPTRQEQSLSDMVIFLFKDDETGPVKRSATERR